MARIAALAGLVLTVAAVGTVLAQGGFLQPFDGAPSAPQPYPSVPGLAAWDVSVHARDESTFPELELMAASHGPDCSGPPNTHPTDGSHTGAVFACNNHVMTALNASGYGVIYLTPPVVADWTDQPAVIQWDMSTSRTSLRDWVDLWVSPMEEHLQLPLYEGFPDLAGPPRNALLVKMDQYGAGQTIFRSGVYRDFIGEGVADTYWGGYEPVLVGGPSAARRDTFQLTISRTHLKFGLPAYNLWWQDSDIPPLTWTSGVVQLGHHSYTPTKDCEPVGEITCLPNTWHWDNVQVSPSLPFTVTRAQQERVSAATASAVTFPVPASPGSHLRFAGAGEQYQVSFDGGTTWQAAALQPAQGGVHPDRAQSYWTPVPDGTQRVDLRAQGGAWGGWLARDLSLWSQVEVAPNRRTPTPTPGAPTPTPTVPPTLTPGPTATDLPTPTSLPTVTPTPVGMPTATATLGPRCGRVDEINGGLVWSPLPAAQCMQ